MEFIGTQNQEETYDSEDMARNAAQTHNDKSGGIWALIQKLEGKLEWEPIVGDLAKYIVTSSFHPLVRSGGMYTYLQQKTSKSRSKSAIGNNGRTLCFLSCSTFQHLLFG